MYTGDLLGLDRGRRQAPVRLRRGPLHCSGSIGRSAWQAILIADTLTIIIVKGIQGGFRIGFNYSSCSCRKSGRNMRSAEEHPGVVREYLAGQCAQGTVLGPFNPIGFPEVQTSDFGVIPKSSGGWRLIVDLSSPGGWSVNDGIQEDLCSVSYVRLEDAAKSDRGTGKGLSAVKVDIKQAYRMVPVHRHCWGRCE